MFLFQVEKYNYRGDAMFDTSSLTITVNNKAYGLKYIEEAKPWLASVLSNQKQTAVFLSDDEKMMSIVAKINGGVVIFNLKQNEKGLWDLTKFQHFNNIEDGFVKLDITKPDILTMKNPKTTISTSTSKTTDPINIHNEINNYVKVNIEMVKSPEISMAQKGKRLTT